MTKKKAGWRLTDRAFGNVEEIKESGNFASDSEAVSFALGIALAYLRAEQDGYNQMVMRRPDGQERMIQVVTS